MLIRNTSKDKATPMIYTHEDYTIGWISALAIELTAAQALLDEEHEDLPATLGDNNAYTLGRIGKHNIVLACLPSGVIGTNAAAYAAANLFRTFTNVRFVLLVGVGGGVPAAGVRLGDVVVSIPSEQSGGVIQYDRGTNIEDGDLIRKGCLRDAPAAVRTAVARLQASAARDGHKISLYHNEMLRKTPRLAHTFERPPEDNLYSANYLHGNEALDGSMCNKSSITQRSPRSQVVVHYGIVGSGNQVIRNAAYRDELYEKDKIICFEMEAAGLMGSMECIVIRGICDYCDTHKNKDWQPYASAVAAAYTKELLTHIPLIPVIKKDIPGDHEKRASFLQALYKHTCPYEERKDRNIARVQGTCQWFILHPLFLAWSSRVSGLLWVSADPGCGKSVLARYLVDVYLPTSNPSTRRTICYFFFKDDFDDQKTSKNLLCALIRQLVEQRPSIFDKVIYDRYARDGDHSLSSFRALWNIFISACSHQDAGEVICVIDALDECQRDGATELIEAICQQQNSPSETKLKLLVTSRPYFYINDAFWSVKDQLHTIHLCGENEAETELITQEIDLVIDHRLKEIGERRDLNTEELSALRAKLTTTPHRTYLWVHLAFAHLEKTLGLTTDRVENILKELPQSVDEAYNKILDRSTDQASAKMLLATILVAVRPLTLDDARHLLALQPSYKSVADLPNIVESDERCYRRVRNICGLFIVIVDSRIYLLHQTAREFLLNQQLPEVHIAHTITNSSVLDMVHKESLAWKGSLTLEQCNAILAEKCIRFLLLDHSDCDASSGKENFREYCLRFWPTHTREASSMLQQETVQLAANLCRLLSDEAYATCSCWSSGFSGLEKTMHGMNLSASNILRPAYHGLTAVLEYLLKPQSETYTALKPQPENYTELSRAICWAAYNNQVGAVKVLIEYGANPDFLCQKPKKLSGIRNALAKSFPRLKLQKTSPEILTGLYNVSLNETHEIPLHSAVCHGNIAMTKLLLDHGADVNGADAKGNTALHIAVAGDICLRFYSDPYHKVNLGMISLLLSKKANRLAENKLGHTPLAAFCLRRRYNKEDDEIVEDVFRLLFHKGIRLDKDLEYEISYHPYKRYSTVLLGPARQGRERCVALLLKHGANPKQRQSDGCSLLHVAVKKDSSDMVKLALSYALPVDYQSTEGQTALMQCVSSDMLLLLLKAGANVNTVDRQGRTALMHCCVTRSHEKMLIVLLQAGANIDAADKMGMTALMHYSTSSANAKQLTILLRAGADINAVDKEGRTPLMHLARSAQFQGKVTLEKYLEAGASIDTVDLKGQSALMHAVISPLTYPNNNVFGSGYREDFIKSLLARGASVTLVDRTGKTVLDYAVSEKCEHLFRGAVR